MKAGRFFVTGMLVFTIGLTACGAVKDAKNANNMEKEGNAIARSVDSEKDALKAEGIRVDSLVLFSYGDWSERSAEKKVELRGRLTKFINNLIRYIEIAHHKDMKLKNGGTTFSAEIMKENAMKYINSLDKHEGKTQTYPQAKID